jgi:hypothetical protein
MPATETESRTSSLVDNGVPLTTITPWCLLICLIFYSCLTLWRWDICIGPKIRPFSCVSLEHHLWIHILTEHIHPVPPEQSQFLRIT